MSGRSNHNRDELSSVASFFPALALLASVALLGVSLVYSLGRDKAATNDSKSVASSLDAVSLENNGDSSVDVLPSRGA